MWVLILLCNLSQHSRYEWMACPCRECQVFLYFARLISCLEPCYTLTMQCDKHGMHLFYLRVQWMN
ncbi:hypothetical protein KC19_2G207600 [Ceratodon purpureus]|uniref:Uncharacterized protein n=1 Tax=Ceratodon purpureus TaxID=3225 RepID=A0A8T0IZ42_CERPU|nr:hypothetical protein KC19_2G207600 [Ceratodon purpureus]